LSRKSAPNLLVIGKIIKPHGLRGEAKLLLYEHTSGLLTEEQQIWLQGVSAPVTTLNVEACHLKGPHPRVKFYDIDSREDAEALRNMEVCVNRDEFPAPEPDDYLISDLIGFAVITEDQDELGKIKDAYPLPANDVIELDYNGKDVLIPMIEDIIKLIDFETETVIIDPMEGLLDL